MVKVKDKLTNYLSHNQVENSFRISNISVSLHDRMLSSQVAQSIKSSMPAFMKSCGRSDTFQNLLGGHHSKSRGGGAEVFVAGKFFISTGLGGALKISHFITRLYRTVLEVNYLFHAKSARNYLIQKNSTTPPPLEIEWWPP